MEEDEFVEMEEREEIEEEEEDDEAGSGVARDDITLPRAERLLLIEVASKRRILDIYINCE